MKQDPGDELLFSKLRDAVRLSGERGYAQFAGFLDEREAFAARRYMESIHFENYMLWGGFSGAERVVFGAFPDFLEPSPEAFPIRGVTARFRTVDSLSHRDFMGALLGAGITRAGLGDILLEPGRGVFFCREELTPFLHLQVEKIGRVGVKLMEGAEEPLPPAHLFETLSGVVAAPRLDCLVAGLLGLSREKAAALVESGAVQRNHQPEESGAAQMREGDLLSIRGKGRFCIERLGPQTKKGRLNFTGKKYV